MTNKAVSHGVQTEADFYAGRLQRRQLEEIASEAGIHIPHRQRACKIRFTTFLLAHNKGDLLKAAHTRHTSAKAEHERKRRELANTQRRNGRTSERLRQVTAVDRHSTSPTPTHTFLEILTKDRVKHHYRNFWQATSREALKHHTCAVCGRSRTRTEQKISEVEFAKLPNSHRLAPSPIQQSIVPTVELTRGLLLCRTGCRGNPNEGQLILDV